jgi:hypothetical protein
VEHLHRAGHVDGIAPRHGGGRGQQAGAGHHQARPDPFAGSGEDVAVDGVESATGAEDFVQPIGDQDQLIAWSGAQGAGGASRRISPPIGVAVDLVLPSTPRI